MVKRQQTRYVICERPLVANEYNFEIGRISVMRACVIKRVRPILYGATCIFPEILAQKTFLMLRVPIFMPTTNF